MATSVFFASEVIAELLRKELIGVDPWKDNSEFFWPIFAGIMATNPDDAISIADIGTPTDGRIMKTGETQGLDGFQVRVRSAHYAKARQKMSDILALFEGILRYEVVVQEVQYRVHAIHHLMKPVFIGTDPNNRVSFTLDCIAKFYKLTA